MHVLLVCLLYSGLRLKYCDNLHGIKMHEKPPMTHFTFILSDTDGQLSKKISNDQELIQSDPISCPQNQTGNN